MANTVRQRKASEVLAEKFRDARTRQQLTQVDVAYRARVTPAQVSVIENGSGDPRLSTVERIAAALGLALCVTDSEPAAAR